MPAMLVGQKGTRPLLVITNTLWIGMVEGSLEVKLPTIWTDEKLRWEE
jgi:hypothetical protein